MVDREDLERELDRVCAAAAGPAAGVFGPGSMLWRVDCEAAVFLGAGRALLLQLAHPWVAAGVAGHSQTLADPIGRFHRTFEAVFTLVFGSLDQALAAARRLHRRHVMIQGQLAQAAGPFAEGSRYQANDVAALCWVWATLTDTALVAHDLVLPPLSAEQRERYYAESRLFAALFGLPDAALPADWPAFAAYMEAMQGSGILTVTPAARAIAGQLLSGAGRIWLRTPGWHRALTAELLSPRLRDAFGLDGGEDQRRRAAFAAAWARRAYLLLPSRLRLVGPYQEAAARLRGAGPDPLTRALNRLWVGQPRLPR